MAQHPVIGPIQLGVAWPGRPALACIADWGPAEDWSDWADAQVCHTLRAATGC